MERDRRARVGVGRTGVGSGELGARLFGSTGVRVRDGLEGQKGATTGTEWRGRTIGVLLAEGPQGSDGCRGRVPEQPRMAAGAEYRIGRGGQKPEWP